MRNKPEGDYLSASRIKSMESCSWAYWCNYHLKIPQPPSDALAMGSICHELFEILQLPENKEHYDLIVANKTFEASTLAEEHVLKGIEKNNLSEEHYHLMNKMILVGLNEDFYVDGCSELLEPEFNFDITGEDYDYRIYGLMDKLAVFKKEKVVEIHDYKTSKQKFKGDDLDSNVQAMMYSLAAKKLWPKLKPVVKFVFLRFPKATIQQLEFSNDALKGFEAYLEEFYKKLINYNEDTAVSNFAADKPKPSDGGWGGCLNCGFARYEGHLKKDGTEMWACPYKFGRVYYAIKDSEDKVKKTSLNQEDLKPKKGEKLVKMTYKGCPKFS